VEHVRNAAARLDPSISVRTLDQARSGAEHDSRQMTSLVDLGILIALGIALANLLVVSVDHVQERRRPVAVLAATGVPLGVLRRSVAVEVALPLLPAILLAGGLSIAFAAVIASIDQSPLVVPVGSLVALSALAVGAVAVVTAFTLPALARAARPETLQAE
jgi:ABC-type antimicrobial peptide transport system permease subunit